MASYSRLHAISRQAGSDLSRYSWRIVGESVVGDKLLVDLATGGGSHNAVVGILLSRERGPKPAGHSNLFGAVGVVVKGESKVVIGAPVQIGQLLTSDGSGQAIPASSGQWYIAEALETANAAGEVIRCLVKAPPTRLTF